MPSGPRPTCSCRATTTTGRCRPSPTGEGLLALLRKRGDHLEGKRLGFTYPLLLYPAVQRDFSLAEALASKAGRKVATTLSAPRVESAVQDLTRAVDLLLLYVTFAFCGRLTQDVEFRTTLLDNARRVAEVRDRIVTFYQRLDADAAAGRYPPAALRRPKRRGEGSVPPPLGVRPVHSHVLRLELPACVEAVRMLVLDAVSEASKRPERDELTSFVYGAFDDFLEMYGPAAGMAAARADI
ncbi:MAG TPA: hypothetical protein VGA70_07100 [Longimicrobiales bacterium]|jgi:hypothetical protein